ncbi:MAG: O-antigen ligase family protein [Alphaproteobacteria bacterium]|nr:O-antigen ligase family protein [Alphaproteobacteria bacterium]
MRKLKINSLNIMFLTLFLVPTQIVVNHISLAVSDILVPLQLFLIVLASRNRGLKIKRRTIIIAVLAVFQLLFSLTYVFRNPGDGQYLNVSIVAIFKLFTCMLYSIIFFFNFKTFNKKQHILYLRINTIVGMFFSLMCIVGVTLFYMGIRTFLVRFGYRASATFEDPNLAAMYLLLNLGVSGMYYFVESNKIWKRFTIVTIVMMLISVFLTASKAAVITLGLSLLFTIVVARYLNIIKSLKKPIKALIIIAICLFLIYKYTDLLNGIITRFSNIDDADELTTGRSEIWKTAIVIILSGTNIIHGVGIGMFEVSLPRYGYNAIIHRAHNTYLSIFSECGFVMFLLLVLIVAYIVLHLYKRMFIQRDLISLCMFFSVIVVIIEFFSLNLQNSRTTYIFLTYVYAYISFLHKHFEPEKKI